MFMYVYYSFRLQGYLSSFVVKLALLAVEHPIDPVYNVPRVAVRAVN
jgi:hypothetical protein